MKKLLCMSAILMFALACGPVETEHPCEVSEFCVYDTENKSSDCAEGYEWENPDDFDNYNCVVIPEPVCELDFPEKYLTDTYSTGCPPNSSPSGQGCYCDDGYTLNASADGCVQVCSVNEDCMEDGTACIGGTCVVPPCSPDSCAEGLLCGNDGNCRADPNLLPPAPKMDCPVLSNEECFEDNTCCIPAWDCAGMDCGTLMPFDPEFGHGYWNYPLNGETRQDQYRSYVRKDVWNLIKYASAAVACMSQTWEFGNGHLLGLGDMSEANGDIPGTREGQPGHPEGTHVNGHDMDIAYYQLTGDDNHLRAVCEHYQGGQDAYHCTSEPVNFDLWRTALFLAKMHDNPRLRVIGVDGKLGVQITTAISQMCSAGWIQGEACTNPKVTYETTDNGYGWYHFHHHHFHISVSGGYGLSTANSGPDCFLPGCAEVNPATDPRAQIYQ